MWPWCPPRSSPASWRPRTFCGPQGTASACCGPCVAPSGVGQRRSLSRSCVASSALSKASRRPGSPPTRWLAVFQPEFREDLRFWVATNRKVALRALDLVEAILRDPFSGIGKPEPLKYLAPGVWSRRLTEEHRIVYRVGEGRIDF